MSIFTNCCYCRMSMLSLNAIRKFHGFQFNTTESWLCTILPFFAFVWAIFPIISWTAFAFVPFGLFVKGKLNFRQISLSRNDCFIDISTWFGSSLRKCLQAIKVFRVHHFHSSFFFCLVLIWTVSLVFILLSHLMGKSSILFKQKPIRMNRVRVPGTTNWNC